MTLKKKAGQSATEAILEALGLPADMNVELNPEKIHQDGDTITLDPGFISGMTVQLLVSELDGVFDDDPECYAHEDDMYKSFTEWTKCSKEEYLSGEYEDEHREGLIIRLYAVPVKM